MTDAPVTPYETMRFEPAVMEEGGPVPGIARFGRHWARLERSCGFTGVPLVKEAVEDALRRAVAGATAPLRVRLSFSSSGEPEVTTTPQPTHYPQGFADTPALAIAYAGEGPWPQVAVVTETIDESDPARRYKTTDRYLYELGRPYAPAHGLEDVVFFNTRGELVEAAISNVYVGSARDLVTSPLSSGALPGVLREELLERGLVREGVLSEEDLRAAEVVLVSSSVRGLRRVRVAPGRVSLTAE